MKLFRRLLTLKKIYIPSIILLGYLLGAFISNLIWENKELIIPVNNATTKNWDPLSYWFYPWGKSGVHKGIETFVAPLVTHASEYVLTAHHAANATSFLTSTFGPYQTNLETWTDDYVERVSYLKLINNYTDIDARERAMMEVLPYTTGMSIYKKNPTTNKFELLLPDPTRHGAVAKFPC